MNSLAHEVYEHVRKKEWSKALILFDELLNKCTENTSREQFINYLLGRSECCINLSKYEFAVQDCRRIIGLLNGIESVSNVGAEARQRLLQSLIKLKLFEAAESATLDWIATCKTIPNNYEQISMLQQVQAALHLFAKQHRTNPGAPPEMWPEANGTMQPVRNGLFQHKLYAADQGGSSTHSLQHKVEMFTPIKSLPASNGTPLLPNGQPILVTNLGNEVDGGARWQCRDPPRGLDHFTLCQQFQHTGVCRYGALCVEAHSMDELAEWHRRYDLRITQALQRRDNLSYKDSITNRLNRYENESEILLENMDGVELKCGSSRKVTLSTKNSSYLWTLTLTCAPKTQTSGGVQRVTQPPLILNSLALIDYSHHFYLMKVSLSTGGDTLVEDDLVKTKEWNLKGPLERLEPNQVLTCKVIIGFSADIYGSFSQRVVFDFGLKEMLVTSLNVEVIPGADPREVDLLKKEILVRSERWTERTRSIVKFSSVVVPINPSEAEREEDLVSAYPTPDPISFVVSSATAHDHKPTKYNYRQRMHDLVYIEEMARYNLVSKYNIRTNLSLVKNYILTPSGPHSSSAKYAPQGELFALIKLGRVISEETFEGRLLLNYCLTILLSPVERGGKDNEEACTEEHLTVYEALIEDKTRAGVYLRLSAETVTRLNLKADTSISMDIQFQVNRVPYCEWHLAIDKITDLRILFPEISDKPNIPWSPARHWSDLVDPRLNVKQKEAILAITAPLDVHLPPVLLIGPFGTGKTYTLAQSVKTILREPLTRILICTHSNSAADLYIKEYLHPYVESGREEARPLRIYYHRRWVSTVHPSVLQYTLTEMNQYGMRYFKLPSLDDIIKHRVIVVTLSMAMYLTSLGLPKGHFTHMLLDEAAQTIETEAIMPLALANENTRIVLAGDPMQLNPDVYSGFVRERKLHVSLLERLYDYYPPDFPCKISLCESYRAHQVIVKFTSEIFYEQKLISSGKQPSHKKFFPLTFFTCQGTDAHDTNSTAFYNIAEVYEVVERVAELKREWQESWGEFDDSSIGVMTPYPDQVYRIRNELRKKRLAGVSVERVLNVQGKQFRAVILSTVRTRATCIEDENSSVDYGFLSNPRLLNTAITRAQSLLAVVGDPVALCSIGKCRKVWEKFIRVCERGNSLYGITWPLLQQQLDSIELKKLYGLNPLAPEFIPRRGYIQQALPPPPQTSTAVQPTPPPPQPAVPPLQVVQTQPPPHTVHTHRKMAAVPTPGTSVIPTVPPTNVPPPNVLPPNVPPPNVPPPNVPPPNVPPPNVAAQSSVVPAVPPHLVPQFYPVYYARMLPYPTQILLQTPPPPQGVPPAQVLPPSQGVVPPSTVVPPPQAVPPPQQVQHHPPPPQQQQLATQLTQQQQHHLQQQILNANRQLQEQVQTSRTVVSLLPPNVSPREMLACKEKQVAWYNHLLKTYGVEAATKFSFLLSEHETKQRTLEEQHQSLVPNVSAIQDMFTDKLQLHANAHFTQTNHLMGGVGGSLFSDCTHTERHLERHEHKGPGLRLYERQASIRQQTPPPPPPPPRSLQVLPSPAPPPTPSYASIVRRNKP